MPRLLRTPAGALRLRLLGRRSGPRIGVAPISWGVSGVPGWGAQLPLQRVLTESRELRVDGLEAGPAGFLGRQPRGRPRLKVAAGVLNAHMDRSVLPVVDGHARWLRYLGARVLVISARGDEEPRTAGSEARYWARFFDAVAGLEAVCRQHGLEMAFHPHLGSGVESQDQVERFLVGCETRICLDTGDLALAGMEPAEIVDLAPHRIRHVHLKEVDPDLARDVREGRLEHGQAVSRGLYLPVDSGEGRALRAVAALRRHRFEGWLVIEQAQRLDHAPDPGEGPVAGIRRSVEAVRAVLLSRP